MENGEENMFEIPPKTLDRIKALAREMIESGQKIIDVLTPEGKRMYNIASDRSLLEQSLFEIEIDGTTIYIGERSTG